MARLSIQLLGPFRVSVAGEQTDDFATDKVRALLAYLAVESDRAHRRERLAGLLWPDHSEKTARTNLRRALADLRQAVGDRGVSPSYFVADRKTIQLNVGADVAVDVTEFASRLTAGATEDLEAAVESYQGGFLEGFSIGDGPAFEEWALLQRESLNREMLDALQKLANHYEPLDRDRALASAWRLIELDPWLESAHRQIMRLMAYAGRRSAAVAHYDTMRRTLADELDIEPEAESTRLLESIKAGELDSAPEPVPVKGPIGECPYRGLAAFREADATFFCGRDGFVDQMFAAVNRQPVVAVIVGSSGSGKSSAVFAGLIPRLREDGEWLVATLRPGSSPFTALASALIEVLEPNIDETERLVQSQKLAKALELSDLPVADAALRALEKDPSRTHLLLVVDQSEELYTLCPDPEVQRRFIDALLKTVSPFAVGANRSIVLLVTLRADFMGHALAYRPFADTLQDASLLMGPMTRDELRATIEEPAELQGATFERGLVERLLDDVGQEPGNLPMLEFALTLLWNEQVDGVLTHAGYERIGRVDGALTRYADEALNALDVADQDRARHVFAQLVRPGDGTEDSRRVASRTDLSTEDWQLVQLLADKRLVVTGHDAAGEDIVEVVHEALIHNWDQLQSWLETDRAFRTWQEDLRVAVRGWDAGNRDEGALLRGSPLAQAEQWRDERANELSQAERDYIAASVQWREQAAADRERRRNRLVAGLAAGLVLAVALVAVTLTSRSSAQREAAVSDSLVLAANATDAHRGGEGDLALALALESVAIDNPPAEAVRALAEIGLGIGTRKVLDGHSHAVRDAALSAEGDWALSGSCADLAADGGCNRGELIMWDVPSGGEITRLEGHTDWVNAVALAFDGRTALSGSDDGSIMLWDIAAREPIRRIDADASGIRAVAISADGTTALTGANDGSLALWDLGTAEAIMNLSAHAGPITRVSFGPEAVAGAMGSTALTASADSTIALWDLTTGELARSFSGHSGPVTDVAAHPDGTRILSTGDDLTLRMWDIEGGQQIDQHGFGVNLASVAITPDGRTALFGHKTSIWLWDIEQFEEVGQLQGHSVDETQQSNINAIALSSNGQLSLSAGSDGTLRIWNLSGQLVSRYLASGGDGIDAIALSPDASQLLGGMGTGDLVLWDVGEPEVVGWFSGGGLAVYPNCVAIHPTAPRALACAGDVSGLTDDTSLALWDIEAGTEVRRFEGHVTLVRAVAFLPDGRTALAGSQSVRGNTLGDLILWDLETGEEVRTFDITHDVADIAVSGDGIHAITGSVTEAAVILWDIETGLEIRRFDGHSFPVLNVEFGSDDELVFAAAADGTVLVWDVETGETLRRFVSNDIGGFALDVSPDGRFVMYGSGSGSVTIWDFETTESLHRFTGHEGYVFDVEFHPDGTRAYTSGVDGKLIEWSGFDMSLEEILSWVEDNRYIRNLTCEERDRYHLDPAGCS
ncbi:MAG: hypothetical protein GY722_27395 [bacterium]|nr:hypothetical protein [bacterium]